MRQLIDGLMALSRLGRVELQASAVDLNALVAEARQQLAPELARRSVRWCIAPDLPTVWGDAALLRQMLLQLLSNALKFSAHDQAALIELSWHGTEAAQVVLQLRDEGVGFKPELAGKLFHAFVRLHRAADYPGIGIGLALARKIVERHGGSIEASGQVDQGCSVRITLARAT